MFPTISGICDGFSAAKDPNSTTVLVLFFLPKFSFLLFTELKLEKRDTVRNIKPSVILV